MLLACRSIAKVDVQSRKNPIPFPTFGQPWNQFDTKDCLPKTSLLCDVCFLMLGSSTKGKEFLLSNKNATNFYILNFIFLVHFEKGKKNFDKRKQGQKYSLWDICMFCMKANILLYIFFFFTKHTFFFFSLLFMYLPKKTLRRLH